jgi:hypothetical protein
MQHVITSHKFHMLVPSAVSFHSSLNCSFKRFLHVSCQLLVLDLQKSSTANGVGRERVINAAVMQLWCIIVRITFVWCEIKLFAQLCCVN